jgi:hypothetical protein
MFWQGKVVSVLIYLIKHYMGRGGGGIAPSFLTSEVDGDDW